MHLAIAPLPIILCKVPSRRCQHSNLHNPTTHSELDLMLLLHCHCSLGVEARALWCCCCCCCSQQLEQQQCKTTRSGFNGPDGKIHTKREACMYRLEALDGLHHPATRAGNIHTHSLCKQDPNDAAAGRTAWVAQQHPHHTPICQPDVHSPPQHDTATSRQAAQHYNPSYHTTCGVHGAGLTQPCCDNA